MHCQVSCDQLNLLVKAGSRIEGAQFANSRPPFHKEPPMTLQIFGAIVPSIRFFLDFRKDTGPSRLSACEMRIKIIDVYKDAVDDPGNG